MVIHRNVEGSAEDVVEAHGKDVETQGQYGVNYRHYWVEEADGTVFCLFEGPSKEAEERVHREAHNLVADEIHEVRKGA